MGRKHFGKRRNCSLCVTFFTCLLYKSFENTVGKGEIVHNEQFLHFPQCFLLVWITFLPFLSYTKVSSANSFSVEESKICCLGKR